MKVKDALIMIEHKIFKANIPYNGPKSIKSQSIKAEAKSSRRDACKMNRNIQGADNSRSMSALMHFMIKQQIHLQ